MGLHAGTIVKTSNMELVGLDHSSSNCEDPAAVKTKSELIRPLVRSHCCQRPRKGCSRTTTITTIKIRPITSPIVAAQIIIRSSSGQYNGHVSATNVWFGPKPHRTSPQSCRQVSALLSSSLSSCIRANLSSNTEKMTDRMLTAIPALRMKIFQKQAIWDS